MVWQGLKVPETHFICGVPAGICGPEWQRLNPTTETSLYPANTSDREASPPNVPVFIDSVRNKDFEIFHRSKRELSNSWKTKTKKLLLIREEKKFVPQSLCDILFNTCMHAWSIINNKGNYFSLCTTLHWYTSLFWWQEGTTATEQNKYIHVNSKLPNKQSHSYVLIKQTYVIIDVNIIFSTQTVRGGASLSLYSSLIESCAAFHLLLSLRTNKLRSVSCGADKG